MGIIAKLKDALGIADRRSRRSRVDATDVTVDRDPDAASERAVKGVEAETTDEPSTDSVDAGDGETVADVSEESTPPSADGEPVDAIKGIGSSYAERLGEAGVHTVADLATADADGLSESTGIGTGRIGNWIERAQVRNR